MLLKMKINFLNIVLELLTIFSIISALAVISSTNPIIAIIFLIVLFLNVAFYLILLGLNFIGLIYLVVYIGAITVLFLFIVMMLNIEAISTVELGVNYTKNIPLVFLMACLSLVLFFIIVPSYSVDFGYFEIYKNICYFLINLQDLIFGNQASSSQSFENFFFVLNNFQSLELENIEFFESLSNNFRESSLLKNDVIVQNVNPARLLSEILQIQSIGQAIYGHYSILLLFASILLLLSMITPIVLLSNPKK